MSAPARRDFDQAAAQWDTDPRRLAVAQAIAAAIVRDAAPQPHDEVMDFGAGTGLVTLQLAPRVRSLCAVDGSAGMLAQLERKLATDDIGNVRCLHLNLDAPLALPHGFDLVVSSMTLHHVPELAPLFAAFHAALRSGGRVALADLEQEDGSFHADNTGVHHFGFAHELVQTALAEAGFVDIAFTEATRIGRPQPDGASRFYPVFLVVARRA